MESVPDFCVSALEYIGVCFSTYQYAFHGVAIVIKFAVYIQKNSRHGNSVVSGVGLQALIKTLVNIL